MARAGAFEILYREYYQRVFGLCRRLLSSADLAEDATQEVFVLAYRNFGRYDHERPFWQWIAAIASNHCVDLLRARGRRQALFDDDAEDPETLPSGDAPVLNEIISNEDAAALNEAISSLPDKYRVPLVLAYYHRASYEEIAEQLGVTTNHVGVLLLRARQRLRERCSEGRTEGEGGADR